MSCARRSHCANVWCILCHENSYRTVCVHLNFLVRTTVHLTDTLCTHTHTFPRCMRYHLTQIHFICDDIYILPLRLACVWLGLTTTRRFWFTLITFAHLHPFHRCQRSSPVLLQMANCLERSNDIQWQSQEKHTHTNTIQPKMFVRKLSLSYAHENKVKLQPSRSHSADHFTHYHHFSIPLAAVTSPSFDQNHQQWFSHVSFGTCFSVMWVHNCADAETKPPFRQLIRFNIIFSHPIAVSALPLFTSPSLPPPSTPSIATDLIPVWLHHADRPSVCRSPEYIESLLDRIVYRHLHIPISYSTSLNIIY